MRSLRLEPALEALIAEAAAARGETFSEFLRRAAESRIEATFPAEPLSAFADVLGAVNSGGSDSARRTGEAFGELLTDPARQ